MLATPWHISSCEVKNVNPCYDGHCEEIKSTIFDDLEDTKHQVGNFRIEKGLEQWKHSVNSIDTNVKMPLTLEHPINRAYFKMVEIIRTCIVPPKRKSFHMCEAPGGFVQACLEEFSKETKVK